MMKSFLYLKAFLDIHKQLFRFMVNYKNQVPEYTFNPVVFDSESWQYLWVHQFLKTQHSSEPKIAKIGL